MSKDKKHSHLDLRKSIKVRKLLFQDVNNQTEKDDTKKRYKFIVMKMTFDQGLDAIEKIKKIIENDDFLKKVTIRNFDHEQDADDFIRVYNRAFITAPDPYRSLTYEDIKNFDEKSTFVAILYNRIVGFIFLTIEPLIKSGKTVGKQGVIAGIGVDPRYRRRKIAFLLAAKAAEYFTQNSVDELLCEVYFENKVSYNFIRNFGFQSTGEIYI